MKKILIPAVILIGIITMLPSCKKPQPKPVNPAFRQYIQAFTAGPVSVADPIRIRFSDEFVNDDALNIPVTEEFFSFSPSIKGKTYWVDTQTLEFRPDEKLPQGTRYEAIFHLSKLLSVPDSLSDFEFFFYSMKQALELKVENHKAYSAADLSREKLYGNIVTADVAENDAFPGILKAVQDGKELPVTWTHDSKNQIHYFQVDSVRRTAKRSAVKLSWNGDAIGAPASGELESEILPLGVFAFTEVKVVNGNEKYIVARFSDPLKEDQDLEGLVSLGKKVYLRTSIEDNELRIYPSETKADKLNLTISPAVKNFRGKQLGKGLNEKITFEDNKPSVRFIGQGTILPVSKDLVLPFEAVNVRAVDIKIIKIFESNILQFLQINDLNGNSELARVGKVVLKKTIPLRDVADYSRWNRYSIDLSKLIDPEEGAIYYIRLGIKKNYSTWPCGGIEADPSATMVRNGDISEEESRSWYYYGSYDDYNYYWDEDYDWEQRDNPCKSYYYNSKSVSRNVLVSNFGIIAKDAGQGKLLVVTTDLLTAKPASGVDIKVYDFQQKQIAAATTDGEGMATIPVPAKPFIVVAEKNKQKGYLKLQDGKSLSMSMFDVGGEQVQKGLKGFIYGDRGVWRPGDSLYLMFILEDKNRMLPENHPVTFTLSNPSGQVVKKITRQVSMNGFYNFSTSTTNDAPTGNWTALVKIGNAEFRKNLKIETVKPNRLKINLDFGVPRLQNGEKISAGIQAAWLTGATAANLKTTVNLTLNKTSTKFTEFRNYTFDNPASEFSTEKMTVFEGKLDETGKASFSPEIKMTSAAPGILNAVFETTVYEEGGDFSIDRFPIPYYPYTSYAGIRSLKNDMMLYTDRNNKIDLVNVDSDGNPVKNGSLMVEILKLDWRWWWDDSGGSGDAVYISSYYNKVTDSGTVRIVNGQGVFEFFKDDEDWGRYFIRVTDKRSGHVAGKVVYVDWYGYSRSESGEKQAVTMLTFATDKEKYKTGDKVKLNFPSSEGARALLTIENGSGVLQSYWINTTKDNTRFEFDVTPEMAPNCYASITLIQKHAQTVNDLPIRLYGVVPILVEDPASVLHPEIIMKDKLRPAENVSITVKESKGAEMTYTLALVDEGLLDLTRFRTPDPHGAFYAREALGVRTWDLFDEVMGAWSGELQRILSIGGDQEAMNKGALKANRFKPVVKFLGPFSLPKGASKTHTFKMSEYVGSVRVMVVAGNKGAYGSAEKTVPVRKPLMVLGTLPRAVGPGESIEMPVTVFAMEKNVRDATVKITADQFFIIEGGDSKNVHFNTTGDKVVTFRLKVKGSVGVGKVTITAVSGNERSSHEIELDVRNPNFPVTEVTEFTLSPGKIWNGDFLLPGMPGTNKVKVELGTFASFNLEERLGYLLEYPHGCAEQITSGAFPQLYLNDLLDLKDSEKQQVSNNIRQALLMIRNMQNPNGGINLWPGSAYPDDWTTNYSGHFMLEAMSKGYTLPAGLLTEWKKYQKEKANSWKYNASYYNDDLMQAYRLFTLAVAGAAELGAMNVLMEQKALSAAAKWRLAAAYQVAGRPEAALKLINAAPKSINPYREMDLTYGSDLRDEAMIIETLILMNKRNDAASLVKSVAGKLSSRTWMSTQTTAYALMAVSKYTMGAKGEGMEVTWKLGNGKEEKISTRKTVASARLPVTDKSGRSSISIKNDGKNVVMGRIISRGIPANDEAKASESNLRMSVSYATADGKPLDLSAIPCGTVFYATITVTNPGLRGMYRQLALTQPVAAGWEIINSRMSDFAAAGTSASAFQYQDIRDERLFTYFDLSPGTKTFRVMMTAAYAGRYYLPPLYCEAMYDNSIHALIPGRWVEVIHEAQ